jgi:hypothetical protein
MLYGHLSDPSQEYFIQPKEAASSSTPAPTSLLSNSQYVTNSSISSTAPFDWYHSYHINYSLVPDTLLTPSLAVQVLFSGKVVQLLSKFHKESPQNLSTKYQPLGVRSGTGSLSKRSGRQREEVSELDGIYHYFTSAQRGKPLPKDGDGDGEREDEDEGSVNEENQSSEFKSSALQSVPIRRSIIDQHTTKDSSLPYQDIFHLPEYLERIWNESIPFPSMKSSASAAFASGCSGFEYLKAIHQNYQKAILSWDPNLIREEIENLIHEIYQQSSNELWNEMTKGRGQPQEQGQQEGMGQGQGQQHEKRITIYQQLEFMRNTYLCGKGEFYQVSLSLHSLPFPLSLDLSLSPSFGLPIPSLSLSSLTSFRRHSLIISIGSSPPLIPLHPLLPLPLSPQ